MIHNPDTYLDQLQPAEGFFYDEARGDAVCNWLEKYITCTSAEWMGQGFKLIPWQRKIIQIVYGFVHEETKLRQYRQVFIFVPKKNGKTELLSGLSLFHLIADGENAPEVYCVAANFDQAKIAWEGANTMTENHPVLNTRAGLRSRHNPIRIDSPRNKGKFRPLSSIARGKQGFRPSVIIGDEMHEWRGRDLYDALTHPNATMTRKQPLVFIITTAGEQEDHICNELYAKALSIQYGETQDTQFLPAVWGIDEREDWTNHETHKKVNPSWGYTIQPTVIAKLCEDAQKTEFDEANFKRWSLNLFVRKLARKWIPMVEWDECAVDRETENFDSMFQHLPVFGGLDFAPKNDLTSLAFVVRSPFDNKIYAKFYNWATEVEIKRKTKAEGIPFDKWQMDGWLESDKAKAFEPEMLKGFLEKITPNYPVRSLGYDANRIGTMMTKFDEEVAFDCLDIPNTCRSLNEASTVLYNAVSNGNFVHYDDPLLRYCAVNCHVKADNSGLIKPDKTMIQYKIDPIMALIMAIDCMIREEEAEQAPPKPQAVPVLERVPMHTHGLRSMLNA